MTRAACPDGGRPIFRLLLLLVLVAPQARADQPLQPPADHAVRSPNGRCTARAEAVADQVRVSGRAPDGAAVSWSVPGWHRVLVLGDD